MPVQVNVEYEVGRGGARYGSTWLPADFTVTLAPIINPALNVGVRLTMRATADGPECREVAVYSTTDEGGVPARALRGFKLEDWVERACAHAALTLDAESEGGVTSWSLPDPGEGHQVRTDVRRARKTARGTGYTNEFLTEVADVYNDGGTTPTKAVREAFRVAQSTAQLYVRYARDAGLIAPTKTSKR